MSRLYTSEVRFVAVILALSLLLPLSTFAQGPDIPDQLPTPANTVNCFDYYRFGSVQVDLTTTLPQTIPGVPLTFTGMLKNENTYPVVGGSVYVKIFKHDEGETKRNGYPLVAFFEAGKDINIPASSEQPFSFDWQVPQSLSGGSYEADFFFVTEHRFNLLGLSFTDDVTGNKTSFRITSDTADQVVFQKDEVTLNGEPYSFAAFPPHLDIDTPATVAVKVSNPSEIDKTVVLSWRLYNWDGLRGDALLDTKAESITLKAGETKTVSYTTTKQKGAVSYIIGTLTDGDANSIINPRFVRDNIEETRLNFPSLTNFPLKSGEANTLFSCVHSTNLPVVEGNTITMTLSDTETGDVIHTYTYEGQVTGAMMGVADTFTPTDSYGKVTLTTTLTKSGETVDTVISTYDCNTLGIECPTKNPVTASMTKGTSAIFTVVMVVILVVFVLAVFTLMRRRQNEEDSEDSGGEMPTNIDLK